MYSSCKSISISKLEYISLQRFHWILWLEIDAYVSFIVHTDFYMVSVAELILIDLITTQKTQKHKWELLQLIQKLKVTNITLRNGTACLLVQSSLHTCFYFIHLFNFIRLYNWLRFIPVNGRIVFITIVVLFESQKVILIFFI